MKSLAASCPSSSCGLRICGGDAIAFIASSVSLSVLAASAIAAAAGYWFTIQRDTCPSLIRYQLMLIRYRMFTLVQLRCFIAVAEDLNLRRAARRLNMTQPPLTRHIQALEQQVGAQLLDRTGRALRLTPAGQSLERSARRRILDDAAEATRDVQKVARGDAGGLIVAFTAASSYAFLPNLVALLRERLPAIALTLRELTTPEQIVALKSRQVDFCLLRPPVSIAGIQTMRVYRERLVLAVPAQHELAARAEVNVSDLSGEVLITYPPVEGPYFHRLVMGLIHSAV